MKKKLTLLLALLAFVLNACGLAREADPEWAELEENFQPLPIVEETLATDEETLAPEEETALIPEEASEAEGAVEAAPGAEPAEGTALETEPEAALLPRDGSYTSKEDVSLYIYQYGCLPDNFITKREAEDLGWPGGSLEPYAPGKCIGGSRFGNYEGLLPDAPGRSWTECDIDTLGARSRGAKRIVFSNDGLIYYTGDHYESFELLYGEEGG